MYILYTEYRKPPFSEDYGLWKIGCLDD